MSAVLQTDTQRSADWFQARTGKVTASRVKDVMAKLKSGKPAAAREQYLLELAVERVTGEAYRHFATTAMQWGTDQETAARIEYAWRNGIEVAETGFLQHSELAFGCSPDGLVGDDGLVEFKCPFNPTVHVETILSGAMPEEHRPQVQAQMAVTGRQWVDLCSFDPRMPDGLQLFTVRVYRDAAYIDTLLAEVGQFLGELDEIVGRLQRFKERA